MLPKHPWEYTPFTEQEQAGIKRLFQDESYKPALDWILNVCGLRDLSYRSESSRDTDFAEGKRWVALQIVRCATLPMQQKKRPAESGRKPKRTA